MHVLIIHQAFASIDEPGGTRHHEFARELANAGYRVTILASPVSYLSGKAASEKIPWVSKETDGDRITILRCYTISALHRSFVHRVFSFISFMISSFIIGMGVDHVDLVWGTSPPIFQGVTAWLIARLKGARFLFEVRDLWPAFAIAVGVLKNRILIELSEGLEQFLYRRADMVMVNSPGVIPHVRGNGARRVKLIPNGADRGMFYCPEPGAFKVQNHLEGQFVAMYTGAFGLSNDLGVVIQAAKLLQSRQDIQFVLVGDGKEKANLQKQAADLNLKNVLFLPSVSKAGMAQVLAGSDACIAILKPLELYKTTYPNKVFDYMAAGKPVLLAIDGVIRDVVEDAKAGLFCKPGDAQALADNIIRMAEHPQERMEMGKLGEQYLEDHFSRRKIAQDLIHLLEKMDGGNDGKNPGRG
jgi:glycosyltransferase involved in cell wall biosynthesis